MKRYLRAPSISKQKHRDGKTTPTWMGQIPSYFAVFKVPCIMLKPCKQMGSWNLSSGSSVKTPSPPSSPPGSYRPGSPPALSYYPQLSPKRPSSPVTLPFCSRTSSHSGLLPRALLTGRYPALQEGSSSPSASAGPGRPTAHAPRRAGAVRQAGRGSRSAGEALATQRQERASRGGGVLETPERWKLRRRRRPRRLGTKSSVGAGRGRGCGPTWRRDARPREAPRPRARAQPRPGVGGAVRAPGRPPTLPHASGFAFPVPRQREMRSGFPVVIGVSWGVKVFGVVGLA